MFDKEAEEYRAHFENELYLFDNIDIFPNDIEEAYQKGAICGYNKAREDADKIIQSLLTIIYTESRTDIYVKEICDAKTFLEGNCTTKGE